MALEKGTYRGIAFTVDSDTGAPVTEVAGPAGKTLLEGMKELVDSAAQDTLRQRMMPVRCFGKELVLSEAFSRSSLGYSGSPTTNSDAITIGYQDMVVTGNGSSSVNYYNGTLWSETDLSDPDDPTKLHPRLRFRLRFHVPGTTATGGLFVFLFSGSGTSNAAGSAIFGANAGSLKPGTHEVEFTIPSTSAFGTFDPTAVSGIGFRMANTSAAGVSVYIQCVQPWIDYSPVPVTWRIDDGRADAYQIACELEEHGWFGCFPVIGSLVGTANHLTLAQVLELDRRGHLICNHSYEADNWTQVDSDQKAAGLLRNRQWLIDNGLTRGADIFAVPNGFTTDTSDQDDMDMIFRHAGIMMNTVPTLRYFRGANPNEGSNAYTNVAHGQARPWDRRCVTSAVAPVNTADLDDAIELGLFTQVLLHDLSDTGSEPSEAEFRAFMTALRAHEMAGRCEVMTMDQIMAGDRPRGHEATATGWANARA